MGASLLLRLDGTGGTRPRSEGNAAQLQEALVDGRADDCGALDVGDLDHAPHRARGRHDDAERRTGLGLHVLFRLARSQAEIGATLGVVVPTTSPVRRVVEIAHVEGAAVVCTSVDEGVLRLRNVSLAPGSGTAGPVET